MLLVALSHATSKDTVKLYAWRLMNKHGQTIKEHWP